MVREKHKTINFIVQIVRVFVSVLFIFSGFVKLVDPIGSQYKFEEYFSAGVLNIEFLIPYALTFSIVLIVAEIVLGIALLVGWKTKFTLASLKVMIVFFLFLTWYSAYYNKVTDCGCFGDAIPLTPWQSFGKDVLLTILIFFLGRYKRFINPIFSRLRPGVVVFYATVLSGAIIYYVLHNLPLIDFRAYKIGTNIEEGMQYKDDGKLPPIHDLFLEDTQQDLAPVILKKEKVMLIIAYDLNKAQLKGFEKIKVSADNAKAKGYTVYGVSASFSDIIELTKNKYNLNFEFLFCDETTLKTMIRSNPGVMILNNGTIVDKKNWRDVDDIEL